MSNRMNLVLVATLLVGVGAVNKTSAVDDIAPNMPVKGTVVVAKDVEVTISPEIKLNLRSVKTAQGIKVRLEMPGVTLEAAQLRIEPTGQIVEIQVDQDGKMHVRTLPVRRPN